MNQSFAVWRPKLDLILCSSSSSPNHSHSYDSRSRSYSPREEYSCRSRSRSISSRSRSESSLSPSPRSGRGKHTTRHVSLLPLSGGGYVADTPGFNQPSLLKVTKQSLALCFPEVRKILSDSQPLKCAFSNCLHIGEPGCLVKTEWERYPYYFQLLDEIKIREEFQLRTLGTKREGDVRFKMGDMGIKQAEPRLEPKKHRRQSRKTTKQSFLNDLENELEDDDDESFLDDDPIIRAMENEKQ